MAFINQAVTVLQTLVIALGAGLAVWGVVNLMEGYGNEDVYKRQIKNIFAIPMIPIAGLLFAMRPLTLPVCWQPGGNGKSLVNI